MKKTAALSALFVAFCTQASAAEAPVVGEWLVADKVARIAVAPCQDVKEAMCGKISWTQTPGGVDDKNPDPAKRNQPVVGLQILNTMKPTAPNRWEGEIYNAENGKTYKASISLENPDVLKVQGCVLGILCGGENWTRWKEDPAAPGARQPGTAAKTPPAARTTGSTTGQGSTAPAPRTSGPATSAPSTSPAPAAPGVPAR